MHKQRHTESKLYEHILHLKKKKEPCINVKYKSHRQTHSFHCQCSNSQQGSSSNSQNQPGVRQQEIKSHGDALFTSPATALEVHGCPFVVTLQKKKHQALMMHDKRRAVISCI